MRTYDPDALASAMEQYADFTEGFDPYEWIADRGNIALTDGEGSYGLFQQEGSPGLYCGHYFFEVRGKAAHELAKAMLHEALETAEVICGMTPVAKAGARWLSRRLGFTSHGIVETASGPHELFIQTKKEFQQWAE